MIGQVAAAVATACVSGTDQCPTCGHSQTTGLWLMIGFLGQAVFTARFLAQWVASEKRRDSIVPVIFWWLSMAGGMLLLAYALHRRDPVITVGQSMGVFIYVRNLMLVAKGKRRAMRKAADTNNQNLVEPSPDHADPRPFSNQARTLRVDGPGTRR